MSLSENWRDTESHTSFSVEDIQDTSSQMWLENTNMAKWQVFTTLYTIAQSWDWIKVTSIKHVISNYNEIKLDNWCHGSRLLSEFDAAAPTSNGDGVFIEVGLLDLGLVIKSLSFFVVALVDLRLAEPWSLSLIVLISLATDGIIVVLILDMMLLLLLDT